MKRRSPERATSIRKILAVGAAAFFSVFAVAIPSSTTFAQSADTEMRGFCECCETRTPAERAAAGCLGPRILDSVPGNVGAAQPAGAAAQPRAEIPPPPPRPPRDRRLRPAAPYPVAPSVQAAPAPVASDRLTQATPYQTRVFRGFNPNSPAASFTGRVNQVNLNGRRTSLVDAPANPYTSAAGVRAFIQTALDHRQPSFTGNCWQFVREAVVRAGLAPRNADLRTNNARERVTKLQRAGFTNLLASNPSLAQHPEDAPVGAVLIYAFPGNNRDPGDVQIRSEHGYISDTFWPVSFYHQTPGARSRVIGVMVRDDRNR